jgi:hypothetical protein
MRVPQVSERIKEAPAQALRGVFAGIGQLLLITDKLRNKGSHQDVPRARTPGASASVTDTAVTSPAGQGAGTAAAPAGTVAEAAPAGAAPAGAAPVAAAAPAAPGPAESSAAKPPTARRAAKPAAGKPVTPKPAAKPVTAKPPTARRPAAKAAAESAAAAGEAPPKPPKRQSTRDFDKTGNVRLLGDETADPAAAAAPQPAAGPEPAAAADPAPLPNYDELSVASLRARLRNLDVTQVRQLAEYERAHAARAEVLTMFERRIAKLEAEA